MISSMVGRVPRPATGDYPLGLLILQQHGRHVTCGDTIGRQTYPDESSSWLKVSICPEFVT